jgi:hypothetical protein
VDVAFGEAETQIQKNWNNVAIHITFSLGSIPKFQKDAKASLLYARSSFIQ